MISKEENKKRKENNDSSTELGCGDNVLPFIPPFVICNGLRYAIPYDSTTKPIFIKDRFIGQSLDVVLGTMFRKHRGKQPIEEAAAHWHSEIKAGRIKVRYKKKYKGDPWEWKLAIADPPIIVTKAMSVRLQQHIHEKVVPAIRPTILSDTENWVAINKPAGLSTVDETSGGVNSLITLVKEELIKISSNNNNDIKLQPAHRLDKPVSGVLLFGKSPSKAATLLREIQQAAREECGVEKVYIARVRRNPKSIELVKGTGLRNAANPDNHKNFPKKITVESELGWDNPNRKAVVVNPEDATTGVSNRQVSLDGMQRIYNRKREGYELRNSKRIKLEEKTSILLRSNQLKIQIHTTKFRRIDDDSQPDDGTVLIECRPLTGQRHQIRAHLAAIGWPIANDVVYGGVMDTPVSEILSPYVDDEAGRLWNELRSPQVIREWCTKCKWTINMLSSANKATMGNDKSHTAIHSLHVEKGIWLHSRRYVLPKAGIDLEAPLPDWAQF